MPESDPWVSALDGMPPVLALRLESLLQDHDFPAMSAQIMRVCQLAGNENEKLDRLTDEILKDVALTNRLLRVVNTVRFAGRMGGVGTVSRAVSMLGFQTVRNLALGLVLLDHLSASGQRQRVQASYVRALFGATLAREWHPLAADAEEVFLGGLMQGLGRMLVACFFPEESEVIDARLARDASRERAVVCQVIGVPHEALGIAVARYWGLPEATLRIMDRHEGTPPTRVPHETLDRMRWTVGAATMTVDDLWTADVSQIERTIDVCCRRYAAVLGRPVDSMRAGFEAARLRMTETVKIIGLPTGEVGATGSWLLLRGGTGPVADLGSATQPLGAGSTHPLSTHLAQALQDATDAMAEDRPAASAAQRVLLEALCTALSCRCVVLCVRQEGPRELLIGARGLGLGGDALSRAFRVPMGDTDDLFSALCRQPRDTWIEDAGQRTVMARLPGSVSWRNPCRC